MAPNLARVVLLSVVASCSFAEAPSDPELFRAVQQSNVSEVARLLDAGANANALNSAGATPLMWAIPNLAKVRLLVNHGANVNARSRSLDRTPLLIAAGYPNSVEVLKLLLDRGAELRAKDRAGNDALVRAALFADIAVMKFLRDQGLEINDATGGSPALVAATNRAYSCINRK